MHSQMENKTKEVENLPKRHGNGTASNLRYFINSTLNDNNFCKCAKI